MNNEPVIGTLILSPINEIDLNNSANSTFSYPSESRGGIVIPPSNGDTEINVDDLTKNSPSNIMPVKITTLPMRLDQMNNSNSNSQRGRFMVSNSFDESLLPEPEHVSAIFNPTGSARSTATSKSTKNSPKNDNKNINNSKDGEVYV
jgi:hypothetical protein